MIVIIIAAVICVCATFCKTLHFGIVYKLFHHYSLNPFPSGV